MGSAKEQEEKRATHMIIEGLCGEALQVAMDIGHEELMKETGILKLSKGIYDIVYPHIRREVRDATTRAEDMWSPSKAI